MNILVSNSRASYYVGGTEVVSLRQSVELARLGHEVVEVVRATDDPTEYFEEFAATIENEGLPVTIEEIGVDAPEGNGSDWGLWHAEALAFGREATPSYLRHIRDGVGLLVAHMSTDSIFLPSQTPGTLHLHGSPKGTDMLMDTTMAVNGDSCIAHADSVHDWWKSRYPNKRYDIFRNGVDAEAFYGDPNGNRPIDVLYVGRFLDYKGVTDVLNAVDPDAHFVIAGSGPYEEAILRIIDERGLTHTNLIVSPGNRELKELYAKAKIFACPSRSEEGVLTTMLEAAASGCAILTARGSGMTDLVVDGRNGLLVDPSSVEQIAQGIVSLLGDDRNRIALATNIQRDVAAHWSWTAKGRELERIYEDIVRR